jgi:membrane glycosyltransferase
VNTIANSRAQLSSKDAAEKGVKDAIRRMTVVMSAYLTTYLWIVCDDQAFISHLIELLNNKIIIISLALIFNWLCLNLLLCIIGLIMSVCFRI